MVISAEIHRGRGGLDFVRLYLMLWTLRYGFYLDIFMLSYLLLLTKCRLNFCGYKNSSMASPSLMSVINIICHIQTNREKENNDDVHGAG